jgi:hypothetical protein
MLAWTQSQLQIQDLLELLMCPLGQTSSSINTTWVKLTISAAQLVALTSSTSYVHKGINKLEILNGLGKLEKNSTMVGACSLASGGHSH